MAWSPMAWLVRPAVAWLVMWAVPFHALVTVDLQIRGPAHFHLDAAGGKHSHSHCLSPGPECVERHHHHSGDVSVVIVEDDIALEPFLLEEEEAPGWTSTVLIALVSTGAALHFLSMRDIRPVGGALIPQTHLPGPLDRPPSTNRA